MGKKFQVHPIAKAFASVHVTHPKQEEVVAKIGSAATQRPDVSLVVLTGVTGVGKSDALFQFIIEYLAAMADEMEADPSLRPIVYTTAVASDDKEFDWGRLYSDARQALKDPFAQTRARRNDGRKAERVLNGETPFTAAMREQLEAEFRAHDTRIWIIDEAQHVLLGDTRTKPGDKYDVLKSIAQTSGVRLVLSGTFDLPSCMSYGGQLSRRSAVIPLHRYRNTANELKPFLTACHELLKQLPEGWTAPRVKDVAEEFYVGALGSIGLFKEWAMRALLEALNEGSNRITIDNFRETRLSPMQLARLNAEVVRGEASFSALGQPLHRDLIKAILSGAEVKPPKEHVRKQPKEAFPRVGGGPPRLPGTRKPTRDPVGAQL